MSFSPSRGIQLIMRLTTHVHRHLSSCRRQWRERYAARRLGAARRLRAAEAQPIALDQFEAVGAGGTRGYAFAVGSASQLDAVSWINADQVIVRFSEQVNIDQGDLVLTGVNVGSYSFSGFQTETGPTGEFQAVWTVIAPIGSDKLRITLDGTTGGAVTDTLGNVLDGDWVDSTSTYNSGDGSAGGDFAFRFNVLHSDSSGDGNVTLNPDVQGILNGLGTSIGAGGYSPFSDLNGDGFVTLNPDVQATLGNVGASLPAGEPSGPAAITTIDFGAYSIDSYGGAQDVTGTSPVEDNGATLHLAGNNWKKIDFAYEVTADTVLEFDFRSANEGEIHAIGFDTDLNVGSPASFQLHGTQAWTGGQSAYYDYGPTAPNTKHYVIPVGQFFTGPVSFLIFGNDDGRFAAGDSVFSNIRVYDI
jgi:hypothetical protein